MRARIVPSIADGRTAGIIAMGSGGTRALDELTRGGVRHTVELAPADLASLTAAIIAPIARRD